jgi:hypothetical protein|tara:strand:+ start:1979 stop:2656 length:678 start_codon:yes stop_codon:yes gene_type:complete
MGATVAVPALTSAFGGTMAASTIAAPALLTAASVTAPMAALTSFSPALISGGGAGFFGNLGSAFSTIQPYSSLFAAGTSILQGVGAYRQGQAMKSQYEMEALQTQAQNEVNKLNWINDANNKARKLMAINASVLASGYARGVNALDGSVKLMMKENEREYVRDIQIAEFNQTSDNNFASAESALLRTAGDTALTGSKFEALGYIGSAAKLFEESRVPTYGTTTKV